MCGSRTCPYPYCAQSLPLIVMIGLGYFAPMAVSAGEVPQSVRLSLDAASAPPEFHINAGSSGNGGSRFFSGNGSLPDLYFSVDRLSTGLPGSVVQSLAPAGADIFVLPTGSPAELFMPAFELGLTPGFFGDELDALDCRLEPGKDSVNAPFDYNVIWRGSSMIGTPVSQFGGWFGPLGPADILIGTTDTIFSRGFDIGLQLGDALDALIMLDVTPDPDEPLGFRFDSDGILQPGLDLAIFSLDPFSPSVTTGGGINPAWTPGTIFLTRFDGSFEVLLAPHELGLTPWDNVDALSFVPEPTTAAAFMLVALLGVAMRRRSGRSALRSIGVLLVTCVWVSSVVPQADASPMRRYCGDAPATIASRGTLELNWADGQVTFFVRASDPWPGINDPDDPDAIQLPPQIAQNAVVVPGSELDPQKIIFSHTTSAGAYTLSFNGNVNIGPAGLGAAVLDVQIVGQGNAVRYLMGDVSEFGFNASFSPPDTEAVICANQPVTYDVKLEPSSKWPPSGQWRIEGLPPHLFEVTPANGQWEALNPDEMLLVPVQIKMLQASAEPHTMNLVVTGNLGATCYPIGPSYEPTEVIFRVPSMTCRLEGRVKQTFGQDVYTFGQDVYFESGDTATLRVTLSNPCADIITGTYTISGGEGAYDTALTRPFTIPPFEKAYEDYVRITNVASPSGPVEFKLDVNPDQVMPCTAPETVRANFAPPRIQRISSYYTERRADGSKPVHAAFLGGVSTSENFEVQVDWRGRDPSEVIFHFGHQNLHVPTGGETASAVKEMETLPIGSKVAATAVTTDGTRSKPFAAALDVVNVPIKLPPLSYLKTMQFTTAPRGELKYTVQAAPIIVAGLMDISTDVLPAPLFKFFGSQQWTWFPKITSDVSVSGSGRSTTTSFIAKKGKKNDDQADDKAEIEKAKANLLPTFFGHELRVKDWEKLKKLGIGIDLEPKFGLIYTIEQNKVDWKFNGGEVGLTGVLKLSIPEEIRTLVSVTSIGPIPWYWQGSVALPLNATVGVKNLTNALQNPSDTQLTGSTSIGLKGGFKIGAGHPKVVGIEGNFGLGSKVDFKWDPWPPQGVYNWQLAVSGVAKIVSFIYDITIASGSCEFNRHCPPPGGAWCITCTLTLGSGFMPPEPKPMARDYLTPDFAEFIGGGALLDPQPIVASVIVANELRHAEPDISSSGSTRLLAWLTDDPLRGPVNRTQAVFSRSDDDTWSVPEAIDDDGTADFHPQIRGFGTQGDAFAAWVNSSQALPDDASLDDLLSTLEIAVARYDGVDQSWSAPVRLTFNDHLDHQPRLAVADDGTAMLIWVSNEWNKVFNTEAQPSAIMYSVYDGADWSAPAAAVADLPHVGDVALAYNGVEAVIAYTGDVDGIFDEESEDSDIELYAVFYSGTSWDVPIRLTDNAELDSSPSVVYDSTNTPLFVWNSGGSIVSARQLDLDDLVEIAPVGLAGAASALATAADGTAVVVWPATLDTPMDLLYAYFDPLAGSWSYPGRLTNDTDGEVWVSATIDSSGTLHSAYMSERVNISTTIIEFEGEVLEIDQEEFIQADLVVTSAQFTTDLEVLPFSIVFDPEIPIPGEPLTITVEIENIGDLAAVDTQVTFFDGDPNDGGAPIATALLSGVLGGGQSAEIQVIWNVPNDGLPHELFVVVDPDELLDDGDRKNNVASRAVVGPDLLIDSVIPLATTTCERTVLVIVGNAGNYPAEATTLVLREENQDGALLAIFDIDPLGPDESVEIEFIWDPPVLNEDGRALLYLSVDETGLIAELDDDNSRVVDVDLVGLGTDCNGNGVADACDIASGVSFDLNGNGIPDECEILYVNAAATGNDDGSSWTDAFTRLQDALEAAEASGGIVQQLWVASGVYTPDEPGGDRGRSFVLVDGVRVYGGFSGSEAQLSQRDLLANVTILSGDLDGDDDGVGGGLVDNSYHVVLAENVGAETVLDGFLIMGGMADGPGQDGYGAGLWIINGGPVIRNCTIAGNTAFYGGGASISNSEAALVNCVFSGNLAIDGAGLHMIGGSTSLVNCTFSLNHAAGMGGGVFSTFADPRITNSILWANEDGDGGGETAQLRIHAGTPFVNYSCIEGLSGDLGGTGNVSNDPLFVNPLGPDGLPGTADDDLALSTGSPCIDAGDNAALPPDFDDLNGNHDGLEPLPFDRNGRPRKVDDPATPDTGSGSAPLVDMGAYEFQAAGKPRALRPRPVQSGNTQFDSSP